MKLKEQKNTLFTRQKYNFQFHSYCASPDSVVQKLRKAEDINESLQKQLKNAKAREKRSKEKVQSIKQELREKNYLTDELEYKLSSYQGLSISIIGRFMA